MAPSPIDIDRLVREVLEQLNGAAAASEVPAAPPAGGGESASGNGQPEPPLGSQPGAGCLAPLGSPGSDSEKQPPGADAALQDKPAQQRPAEAASSPPPQATQGRIMVTARVVTMAELGDRLEGARTLVVPAGAVVTPSVRDHLRRARIQLVTAAPEPSASAAAPGPVPILVNARSLDTATLADTFRRDGLEPDVQQCDCLIESTDRLAASAAEGRRGVLLTRHQAAALCLANRHPGVRAVAAEEPGALQAAVEAVGANVIVLNAKQLGMYRLRQMVGDFLRRGPVECPEVFRNRLG
jgi:hypothetical protein